MVNISFIFDSHPLVHGQKWMGEPGGLLSMGSHRGGHNWSDLAAITHTHTHTHKHTHIYIYIERERERDTYMGFPGSASGKEPACQCRKHKRHRLDPWIGKIPWRRAWQSTPVFLLQNPKDRGAWLATVHRVAKSQKWLKWLGTHAHTYIYTYTHGNI